MCLLLRDSVLNQDRQFQKALRDFSSSTSKATQDVMEMTEWETNIAILSERSHMNLSSAASSWTEIWGRDRWSISPSDCFTTETLLSNWTFAEDAKLSVYWSTIRGSIISGYSAETSMPIIRVMQDHLMDSYSQIRNWITSEIQEPQL